MTDLQERLLKLLMVTDELCRKYDVEYYLLGGTLIGAMRHSGFIPWDDDADVIMTRDNWEKFYNCTKGNLPEGYKISTQYDDENVAMPINRLTETNTTGLFRYHISNPEIAGTQIDIFIMDPVPDTPEARKLYSETVSEFNEFTGLHVQYALRNASDTHFIENWERAKKVGKRQVMNEIAAKAFCFTEEESQLYGQRFAGSPHFWPKEVFGKPQYVPFENTMLAIPERPGDCLAIGYDDDWKMIPRGGPTLSTHDFVVRSYTTPSTVIYADFEKHMDRELVDMTFLERKFEWAPLIFERLKNDTDVQQFEVARVKYVYEKRLKQTDVRKLLEDKKYDELDAFFEDFIEAQSDSKLIGSSSLTGWIQYYRKHHALLIDIGDDALGVLIHLLIHRQKLALAAKIMKARDRVERPLTDELISLNELIAAIRRVISTYGCKEDEECRRLVDEWLQKYPDNPFFVKHDLFLKIRQGLGSEEERRMIEECLQIVPDDAELEYLLAENHYTAGRLEEAISIFVKLVDSTSNGIVLNSIRKKYEELVEHEPDNEEYQKLLVNCLRQCGDPNAMQYVDDDEEEYNYEKEQEEIENGDENESEGEEDTSLSEQELQYADDYEMNAIQQCRLKLLNEVDEICRENEIPYYLAGKILQQAVQYHRYIDPNGEITVAMTADNFRKFNKVIEKKHLKNRAVESLENNPNFFRVVASYVDTDTMDIPLIRFDTVNYPGIHIVIEILRSKEMSKLTEMKNRMLEKGWECRTIQRNQKLSTKVSMKVIDAACSVRGTEKVSKDIFKILTKDHFSISDKMYYIRRFNKSRKYYPAELFADTTEVLLEGKKYPTVSHYNEYLELMFGFDWREKDYPLTNHNKYTRIIDPNLTAAEYKEYLAEHDIDPVQFQKSWKEIDMKYRPIKRKTKRIAKYWHILYACGERDRLYDLYHPQKDEILQLYEAGNYDALMERMSEHIEVARKLARKGVGFSFDSELFDVMIDCLRHEGRDEEADRFITLNEKREWTDIVKE